MSRKFEVLVKEACAAERALRKHTSDRRLSLRCFVAEALKACGSNEETLSEFQAKLTARNGASAPLRGIATYLRAITPMIRGGQVNRPPRDYSRTCFAGRDMAEPELRDLGGNIYFLWALSALRVGEQNPGAFGPVEDLAAYEAKEAALKARCDELCGRIGKEYAQDDLEIGEIKSDGAALITFKLAPGRVPIAPPWNCGERLVAALIGN